MGKVTVKIVSSKYNLNPIKEARHIIFPACRRATVYPQIYYFCHMKQKTHSKFFIPDYLGTLPDKRL
ncbi:MAG: hypothetical protein ACYC01_12130, partial [Lutibacter sp.]